MGEVKLKPLFPDIISGCLESPDCELRKGHQWIGILNHHTGVGNRSREELEGNKPLADKLFKGALSWMSTKDDAYLSAHFAISREGKIVQLVNPETHVAWHAGQSTFWHPDLRRFVSGMNQFMIGIEWHGDGNKLPYTEDQYKAGSELTARLMQHFPTIQPHCITGHEVVSPGRKSDPGKWFDWQKYFEMSYGELRRL